MKEVLLFIHGFGSSAACWNPLLGLLKEDARITGRYELRTWEYPTRWVETNILGRIPSLKEVGRSLADEIDSSTYRGRRLTLVGHSQGGLVILTYLAEMLLRNEGWRLEPVRQAILFATPSEGSTTGLRLRQLFSALVSNPQELTLRVLNPDVADLRALVRERIVGATRDTDATWRVPIHAICGMQDNVVPEASARGPFESVRRVPGTHFSILKPPNRDDPRYAEFAELLLDPGGHSHRFDVDAYEFALRVEPRHAEALQVDSLKHTGQVTYDDYALLRRTVRVAHANRCRQPFTLRYSTRSGVFVKGHTSHRNEVPPAVKGLWQDTGKFFRFDFVPRPGEEYWLNVEVFGGFGPGNRDIHFHFNNLCHARRVRVALDLTPYVSAGWRVTHGPHMYYAREDVEHSELCAHRARRSPVPPSRSGDGLAEWDLTDVRTGIVDLVWDVSAPAGITVSHGEHSTLGG